MKILVSIPSYGSKNIPYLRSIIKELKAFPHRVHIIVFSEAPKQLGPEVEVRVPERLKNPEELPYLHKKVFAERINDFDLFIYLEDDTLFKYQNLKAFLEVTKILPSDLIAGYLRYEVDGQGRRFCSSVHSHYFFDPNFLCTYKGERFARFTNDHSACYVLTQAQLKKAIQSGGYLVKPHSEFYGVLESAATDPYTQCGFKKVICVSRLEDFLLWHMPSNYIGKLGLPLEEVKAQIERLMALDPQKRPYRQLFPTQKKLLSVHCFKRYYERPDPELLKLLPPNVKKVLSVGCGWGAMERLLIEKGMEVWGIPLDPVIAVTAERQGVRILAPDFEEAKHRIGKEAFDCILLANVLQHLSDPVPVLQFLRGFLAPRGYVVGTVPNLRRLFASKLFKRCPPELRNYKNTKMHFTDRSLLKYWLKEAGFKKFKLYGLVDDKYAYLRFLKYSFLEDLVAHSISFVAESQKVAATDKHSFAKTLECT